MHASDGLQEHSAGGWWLAAAIAAAVWALLLVAAVIVFDRAVIPRYLAIWSEFDVVLPGITLSIVSHSRLLLLPPVLSLAAAVVALSAVPARRIGVIVSACVTGLGLLALVLAWLAVHLPMRALVQTLTA